MDEFERIRRTGNGAAEHGSLSDGVERCLWDLETCSSLLCGATSEPILHARREMLEQYSDRTGYLTARPATNGAI